MDHTLFRYDERYTRPHRKTNVFAWTVALLLLTGFALAAWLGSYYIFGHPERPQSYRILQKLDKLDAPKRFELTAAPEGEFLKPGDIYDRFIAMGRAELARKNAELIRNYLRNYQGMANKVPYVVGRFEIMDARPLNQHDLFTSGAVALTRATDRGELLMEHLYPGQASDVPLMQETLSTGLEIRLDRTHDLSAIVHVARLPDGRLLVTAVPLLYGTYTVTRGMATFGLEPPDQLNMEAGWPLFKEPLRRVAEARYERFRQGLPLEDMGVAAVASSSPPQKTGPSSNELVRVAQAQAVPVSTPAETKKGASPTPIIVAKKEGTPPAETTASTPRQTPASRAASPAPAPTQVAKASPSPTVARALPPDVPEVAEANAFEGATPAPVLPAIPVPEDEDNLLASTAGGGTWKTFEPGQMPLGRLVEPGDLDKVAERGTTGERYYLRGQFVVNFVDAHRAVLRPRAGLADSVLRFAGASRSTRIIVEFPQGHRMPAQGSVITRDETRPLEVTEVRRQSDGQINVFAREIIEP